MKFCISDVYFEDMFMVKPAVNVSNKQLRSSMHDVPFGGFSFHHALNQFLLGVMDLAAMMERLPWLWTTCSLLSYHTCSIKNTPLQQVSLTEEGVM